MRYIGDIRKFVGYVPIMAVAVMGILYNEENGLLFDAWKFNCISQRKTGRCLVMGNADESVSGSCAVLSFFIMLQVTNSGSIIFSINIVLLWKQSRVVSKISGNAVWSDWKVRFNKANKNL